MRIRGFLLAGALAVILAPTSGLTQLGPPGGGRQPGGGGPPGGFGGGRPDPNAIWDMFAKGKDSISRSDITDPGQQMMFDRMAQRMGNTTGQITKQQFVENMQQRMAGGGGGRNRGGPGRGAMPPGVMPVGGPPADLNTQPVGDPTEGMFRKLDINGDGFLTTDEMPDDLRAVKDQWDTNKDGMIDLNEYKEFVKSKWQQGQGGPTWIQEETPEEEEEKRPVVYHAGNLPKELLAKAAWFEELDKDNDAQIGLYEWKDSGRPIEEFQKMDRNGDGYLTVEEVLYYYAAQDKAMAKLKGKSRDAASTGRGPGGPGRPGGFGGGGPGWPAPVTADASSPGSFPTPPSMPAIQDAGGQGGPGPRTNGNGGNGGNGRRRGGNGGGRSPGG